MFTRSFYNYRHSIKHELICLTSLSCVLINEFIDALIHGRKPSYTGEDGKRDVQTTMAAICSAKEGLPVRVEEVTDLRFAKIPEASA